MPEASEAVLLAAENSNTYVPLGPEDERIETAGYVVWLGPGSHPSFTVVQRLRLREDEVDATVAEVRLIVRKRGRRGATWEVGSSAAPHDLGERLLSLGMTPDREPVAAAMVLLEPPRRRTKSDILARRVTTLEEYAIAQEIAYEAFEFSETHAREARLRIKRGWGAERNADRGATFLAWLDGEPVASATATFTDAGVVLNAGATRRSARGKGAYSALVEARWRVAVVRGTPALITQAGAMSRPILDRLGFQQVAEILIYLDELDQD